MSYIIAGAIGLIGGIICWITGYRIDNWQYWVILFFGIASFNAGRFVEYKIKK